MLAQSSITNHKPLDSWRGRRRWLRCGPGQQIALPPGSRASVLYALSLVRPAAAARWRLCGGTTAPLFDGDAKLNRHRHSSEEDNLANNVVRRSGCISVRSLRKRSRRLRRLAALISSPCPVIHTQAVDDDSRHVPA